MNDKSEENLEDERSLSPVQQKVLMLLKERIYSSGSMPTLREICKAMGWNAVGSAQTVIQALIEKGFVKRDAQKARGLKIADTDEFRSVPILAAVPAGAPVEALQNHDGDILVPTSLKGPLFAVRVKGDSMINAGLFDRDIAIVRQTERAMNKEIVVAEIEGEFTIKRFIEKKEDLWLFPENEKYKPRKIEDERFRILGKVVGLHRYW